MAKRFTDTNKYKQHFFRSLTAPYKLLWDYINHDCDHAGLWIVDFEIAQTYIGKDFPVSMKVALQLFNGDEKRIVTLDGGKIWFIVPFIDFQYKLPLNPKNAAHTNIIFQLTKHNLLTNDLFLKNLDSSFQGAKDMDKEKEMDKEQVKEQGEPQTSGSQPSQIMFRYWMEKNPEYSKNESTDLPALVSIVKFIRKQITDKLKQQDPHFIPKIQDNQITEMWEAMVEVIITDKFYQQKGLNTISNMVQEIFNKTKTKNGASNTTHKRKSWNTTVVS